MSPSLPSLYPANDASVDAVLCSNCCMPTWVALDSARSVFCQFGGSIGRSLVDTGEAGVSAPIYHILSPGIPAKIGRSIVRAVAVVVTSLHSFGALSSKGGQNKAVDKVCLADAGSKEIDSTPPIRSFHLNKTPFRQLPALQAQPRNRPDLAIAGGLVFGFVARDWSEDLLCCAHGAQG